MRFLERLEEALEREDLPDITRTKLSAMKEYALGGPKMSASEIAAKYRTSNQSIFDWIARWNKVMGEAENQGPDGVKSFFSKDWPNRPKRKSSARKTVEAS